MKRIRGLLLLLLPPPPHTDRTVHLFLSFFLFNPLRLFWPKKTEREREKKTTSTVSCCYIVHRLPSPLRLPPIFFFLWGFTATRPTRGDYELRFQEMWFLFFFVYYHHHHFFSAMVCVCITPFLSFPFDPLLTVKRQHAQGRAISCRHI